MTTHIYTIRCLITFSYCIAWHVYKHTAKQFSYKVTISNINEGYIITAKMLMQVLLSGSVLLSLSLGCESTEERRKDMKIPHIRYRADVTVNVESKSLNESCAEAWVQKMDYLCSKVGSIDVAVGCTYQNVYPVSILSCNCMTYDAATCVVIGECPYTCGLVNETSMWSKEYSVDLPRNVFQLNDVQCGRLNRRGRLCSECKEGFSPQAYSYDLSCIRCQNSGYNWLKFTAIAFIPLTIFYFIVVLFKINAVNPYLYGFITFSQFVASPIFLRSSFLTLKGKYKLAERIIMTPYAIWNLDFFRSLPLNICLNLTTLQILALDYAIALYPIVLVAITYILIELHARGCRLILCLWSPFHKWFVHFTKILDIRSSIVKVFATFLLLSYMKLLNVTLDILLPTAGYSVVNGSQTWYVYYDASYKYFSEHHLPYAIMSIIIFIVFIVTPLMVLILYPLRCFQKCLSVCRLRSHMLQVFVDTFQGHFKDGIDSDTRDCRWFASFYILGRIVIFYIIYGVTKNIISFALVGFFLIVLGIVMIVFQPYKSKKVNTYHTILPFIMAISCFLVTLQDESSVKARKMIRYEVTAIEVFITTPILIIVVYATYYISYRLYNKCRSTSWQVFCFARNRELQFLTQRSIASNYQGIDTS